MSAPQSPDGNDSGAGGADDSDHDNAIGLMHQALRAGGGSGGEYTVFVTRRPGGSSRHLLDEDDEEEEDDDDYHGTYMLSAVCPERAVCACSSDRRTLQMQKRTTRSISRLRKKKSLSTMTRTRTRTESTIMMTKKTKTRKTTTTTTTMLTRVSSLSVHNTRVSSLLTVVIGGPIPYLTHRQLNLLLQGEPLHNVLLSVTDWGGVGDDGRGGGYFGTSRLRRQQLRDPDRFPKVPSVEGRKLMDSGIFGATERTVANKTILDMTFDSHNIHTKIEARRRPLSLRLLDREMGLSERMADRVLGERMIAQSLVPSTDADMVLRYDAPLYLGQFSDDGNFFYSATKDFRVRMYDTSNVNDWHHYKTVVHPSGRWTMTDAALSPDNRWLAFTSMMPQVCLAPTDPNDEGDPYLLDLSDGAPTGDEEYDYYHHSFAIFSVRFSGDGRELVAGTNASSIIVYDIESRRVLHRLDGHENDVNAVCFGDKTSPHLLYSGSDDATIKVWDRRSLGDGRAAGAFVGHCEGITYIDSKGDGRYILSNGKDQTMRLWDLRMAMSMSDFATKNPAQYTRFSLYDYRFQRYNDDLYFKHPHDNSVVTFRGHRVERTLIRCHFSPPGSSDGRYVYSASHSGRVYVWNLDATLAGVIDVREATRQTMAAVAADEDRQSEVGGHNLPSVSARHRSRLRRHASRALCVRDASWHPTAPVLAGMFCFRGFVSLLTNRKLQHLRSMPRAWITALSQCTPANWRATVTPTGGSSGCTTSGCVRSRRCRARPGPRRGGRFREEAELGHPSWLLCFPSPFEYTAPIYSSVSRIKSSCKKRTDILDAMLRSNPTPSILGWHFDTM